MAKATKDKNEYRGVDMLKDDLRREIQQFLLTSKEHFLQLHGGRGSGKTYTTQKTVIEDCILNDVEFCFAVPTKKLRDSGSLKKWISKVMAREFPEYQTRCTAEYFYIRHNEDEDWRLIGRCLALSGADNDSKNDSSIFRVKWFIWDEAMRIKLDVNAASLLVDLFLTAYHTIDRDENRVTAVFIGNALNKLDPVYTFFGITVAELKKPGIIKRSFNRASWYVPVPPDIEEDPDNTFRQMVAGTRYGDIASGNFSLSYGELIDDPGDRPVSAVYSIQFAADSYLLIMPSSGIIYIESCDRAFADKYATGKYTAITKEASPSCRVVPYSLIQIIRSALAAGRCKFVDEESLLTASTRLKMCYNIAIL